MYKKNKKEMHPHNDYPLWNLFETARKAGITSRHLLPDTTS